MIQVKNCPDTIESEYTVVRDCESEGYWYYCSYTSYNRALEAAMFIGNGFVVPTNEIEKV